MSNFTDSLAAGIRAVDHPEAVEQDRRDRMQFKIAPLSQALQADQIRLAAFTDPKTGHAIPEHEEEYEHVMANMQNTIGQMRTLLGEKQPTAGVLDRLHIRRDLQHRVQSWQDQNKQTAASYAEGALPYEQTPEGQKETTRHKNAIEEDKVKYSPSLKLYRMKDGTTAYLDAKHPEDIPEGAAPVSLTQTAPKRVLVEGPNKEPVMAFQEGEQFFDQNHNPIPNAKPYQKPAAMQPKQGTSRQGGGNVFATLTPQGWRVTNTGELLHDFRPMPTFAETGLYEPVMSMDDSTGQMTFGVFNRRTGTTQINGTTNRPVPTPVVQQINKNMQAGLDSNNRYRTMIQSEQAARNGDQQAQLNILSQHLGMTQGAQRGARISQAMWNEAMQSAPWLETKAARWFHKDPETGDYVFDGYKSGVTLTPDQITQMVALAKQRRDIQWAQLKEAGQFYGMNIDTSQLDQPEVPEGPKTKQLRKLQNGGSGEYIYARDPEGQLHRAKKGTTLPQGWRLTNAPAN